MRMRVQGSHCRDQSSVSRIQREGDYGIQGSGVTMWRLGVVDFKIRRDAFQIHCFVRGVLAISFAARVGNLWRDKWTSLSGPLSRHKWPTLMRGSYSVARASRSSCCFLLSASVSTSFAATSSCRASSSSIFPVSSGVSFSGVGLRDNLQV